MSHTWPDRDLPEDLQDPTPVLTWMMVIVGLLTWAFFDWLTQGGPR